MNTRIPASAVKVVRSAYATALLAILGLTWFLTPQVSAQLGSLIVTITSPTAGSTLSGTISVNASVTIVGSLTVAGVQFKMDGVNLGAEDTTAPYSVPWNTTTASNGSHTLTAVARDLLGVQWTSDPVTVTVFNDTTPPTVSITAPASGSTVSSTITVNASASDNVGVVGVQFRLDGANLGAEDITAPYSLSWNTTTATNGSHTLTAVARDAAGNTATSAAVTVTVFNDTTPPTVTITAPTNGATVSGTITVTAGASDNVGVVGVMFFVDDVAVGTEAKVAPYTRTWDTTAASNGPHRLDAVARDAADNRASAAVTVTVANGIPTITSFTPASGPVGTSVTINGTNFTGTTAVTFNGTSASFTVSSATAIQATVPTGATTGPISVTTPGGTATSASAFTVTASAPTITSFTPTSGPVGTSVTISGTNFTGATAVTFNGTSASFTVSSATAIQATVPAGATAGPISVTTPGGTATSASAFTVTASAPTITSFTPTSGPVGTSVTISGTNFTGATAVTFNGTSASFTVSSATAIQATVPAGATTGPISVTTPGGTATSASSFTVTASPPTITSFTPASGPVGTSVTISGTNFTGATAVTFNGTSASFTVSSATAIQATVPAGATTGPISVTTPGGTATSASAFTVVSDTTPPTVTRIEETSPAITYTGTWVQGNTNRAWSGGTAALGASVGARATLSFTGTGVSWIGFHGPQTGIANVYLDGALVATVDTFAPTEEVGAVPYAASGLASGAHTLAIEVTAQKNPSSSDWLIVVDAFDVTGASGAPDTTPPAVAITAPTNGATVSGTTTVTASASDNVGVAGVQFRLDGANLGVEDTTAPYSVPWDTTAASSGSHTLTAVARDAAGNTTTSSGVTVTVSNASPPPTTTATRFEETDRSVLYTPGSSSTQPPAWFHASRSRGWSSAIASFNRSAGARAQFTFTGTSATWIGFRAFWAGIARVSLDGGPATDVDLFVPRCTNAEKLQGCVDEHVQAPAFTATGLAAGPHTLTVEVTGLKHGVGGCDPDPVTGDPKTCAADSAVVVDAFDVAPASPPPTRGTRFEQTTPSVAYTAGWQADTTEPSWSGGTAAETATAGSGATFTFTGTSVSWIGLRGPQTGIARVFLDGAFHAEVDTYSPTEVQAVVLTVTDLAPASHTLRIEATGLKNASSGGTAIVVDAFDVRSRFEDLDPSMTYTVINPGASWVQENRDRAWSGATANSGGGSAAFSRAGTRAEFTFTGTAVSWIGFRGPFAGIADVYLDGAFVERVDLYAPTEDLRVPVFTRAGLAAGPHTLRIDVTGLKNPASTDTFVVVDAFDVTPPSPGAPVARVPETDPSVTYAPASGWTQSSPNSFYTGRTVFSSATVAARAELTFTGTSVRWIGQRGRDMGIARVYLDGAFVAEVDTFVAADNQERFQAAIFSATGLAPATPHTLTIEVTGLKNLSSGGTVIVVDAFDVY